MSVDKSLTENIQAIKDEFKLQIFDDHCKSLVTTRQCCVIRALPKVLSCNRDCSTQAISIANSERVCSPTYPACNVHAPHCHLSAADSTTFLHIISQAERFAKTNVTEHVMCALILSTNFI